MTRGRTNSDGAASHGSEAVVQKEKKKHRKKGVGFWERAKRQRNLTWAFECYSKVVQLPSPVSASLDGRPSFVAWLDPVNADGLRANAWGSVPPEG